MKRATLFGISALATAGIVTWILISGARPQSAAANQPQQQPTMRSATRASMQTGAAKQPAAQYNAAGELLRPKNHREWIFVGAPVTPNDMNDGAAAFPEFHNVYIDPASFAAYQQTGKFPTGTVILKELVSVGGKSMPSGAGYFQGEFVSLEAMVKNAERYPDEPGGWAFYRFGEAPDYSETGARMETDNCNSCHSGATEDYVFTETYPVLRATKPRPAG